MKLDMVNYSVELIDGLTLFCKQYLRECKHYTGGHLVMYIKDKKHTIFDYYLSTHFELKDLISLDLSREESASAVVYVLDCKEFRNYTDDDIIMMASHLAYYLFGALNGIDLYNNFKLKDKTDVFIDESLRY